MLASFHKLLLPPCLGCESLANLHYFLLVLDNVDWTDVSLLPSHHAENQKVRFLRRSVSNGDFTWFGPTNTVQGTVKAASYDSKRPTSPTAGQDQWMTVLPSIDTTLDHRT